MPLSDALTEFVRESLARRLPRPAVEEALLRAGWPADQVRQAIGGFAEVDFPIPVPRPPSTVSSREAFMYVVMFATLVVSAYSLGNLLFELIERAFPDPAVPHFRGPTLPALMGVRSQSMVWPPQML